VHHPCGDRRFWAFWWPHGRITYHLTIMTIRTNNLQWSEWVLFEPPVEGFRTLPKTPGLYRVRATGHTRLVYIGQTGRSLRERVRTLCLRSLDPEMPFNDPHTAAPNLWAWRQSEGWNFEASVAECDLSEADRQALECYLLWQYRLQHGESTLANHGRFHADYWKSESRRSDKRGRKLTKGVRNAASGPSMPPLQPHEDSIGPNWMNLDWHVAVALNTDDIASAPSEPGLYRIVEDDQVSYVGESKDLRSRLQTHVRTWRSTATCSWVTISHATESYQRHELENDLIGMFYSQHGHGPRRQFNPVRS